MSRSDQRTLRHAAKVLDEFADTFFQSIQVDGALHESSEDREYADLKGTASRLRVIARYGT